MAIFDASALFSLAPDSARRFQSHPSIRMSSGASVSPQSQQTISSVSAMNKSGPVKLSVSPAQRRREEGRAVAQFDGAVVRFAWPAVVFVSHTLSRHGTSGEARAVSRRSGFEYV